LSVFDAQAAAILKRPVEELLVAAKVRPDAISEELKKAYFDKTFHLRVRATAQEFKGEMRPRVTVVSADSVDPVSMGNKLLKKIIEKIGVESKAMEPILEVEMARKEESKENRDTNMKEEDEEMPETKKMRMTDMEIEPTPIESKE
jgi:hypothetical protein